MEIHIQKGTSVSVHQQLVTQIAMLIAAGLLKPGARLPSIRALSGRLGVHHNTCLAAYKELESVGLIEIRHGSGARVALTDADRPSVEEAALATQPELSDLEQLSAFFVQQVQRKGYGWPEALAALEAARDKQGRQAHIPLVFVDIHPDIMPVFQRELEQHLGVPVRTALLSELDPATERRSHFVVSRYHYQTLKDILARDPESAKTMAGRITVIDVGSGQQELAVIRQLPADALAVVFSRSTIILNQGEAVVRALRGDEIYLRPILAGQESMAEVQRVLKRAHAVFADCLCRPQLQELTRKPIHLIRVIPDSELEKLSAFRAG